MRMKIFALCAIWFLVVFLNQTKILTADSTKAKNTAIPDALIERKSVSHDFSLFVTPNEVMKKTKHKKTMILVDVGGNTFAFLTGASAPDELGDFNDEINAIIGSMSYSAP